MQLANQKKNLIENVHVITVNWNRFFDTCECIDSILSQKWVNTELIVVDNGSTDNSALRLREKYPNIKIIRSEKNLGFSGGFNIGIKYSLTLDAEFILIINNDTIVKNDMIRKLLDEFDSEDVGVTSPLILYHSDPNKVWSSGGDINKAFLMPINAHHRNEKLDKPVYRTFLSGCCLLMKRELIETIGLFDERFFLYFEDLDYCLRIMRSGWRMKIVPSARLLHKVSSSSGGEFSPRERYYMAYSSILYYKKYINISNFTTIFFFRLISSILWTLRLLFKGEITALCAFWNGYLKGLKIILH